MCQLLDIIKSQKDEQSAKIIHKKLINSEQLISMNQLLHEEGSSLLDEENQSIPGPKIQVIKSYAQPPANSTEEAHIKCLIKLAFTIGVIVLIMIVSLMIELQYNPFTLFQSDNAQEPIDDDQKDEVTEQTDFVIEFKQKPEPSSPSQIPTDSEILKNGRVNPWYQVETQSSMKDKYFFKIPIERMVELSDPKLFFGKAYQKNLQGISEDQLQFALNMLYVTHNVNPKGEVEVELAPYDQDKDIKASRIKQLLDAQEKILQQKYEFKQYLQQQLPFCIVSPSYNNVNNKLYLRYLDSVFMQNYDNFHIVYIDDASPQKTGEYVMAYVKEKGFPEHKIQVIINQNNLFALENIFNAIHYHCNAGQIVALIDGDDALIGRQVFGIFNALYQRTESALIYSNYLHVIFNEKALVGASSKPIPMSLIQRHGGVRNQHAFFTSHLLTFYVDLFRKIKRQDLTYSNGTFFKYAYDVAMCTSMLQMIGDRVFYIPELTYEYRYDTGQNDPGSGQMGVTEIVYSREVYDKLDQLPFIDDRQNYLKTAPKRSVKP